ncbi:MAG: malonic semialdehyde reductase [Gammaproteobacteria bacterium]|nr:malonic semialdehyde reductase [Gammaproteobacteria bacterium]MDH5651640.1 malonic semialdehyde reductase [Gammaproteobacteria bacterium]
MSVSFDSPILDQLFNEARSFSYWQDKPVSHAQITQIYDLMKMGPTAANSCPARLVFVTSEAAKARLKPCLNEGNVAKSMSAPAVAVIGMDLEFYEKLPVLFPHTDARSWFVGKEEKIKHSALLNSCLQGAYLIMAIRSLGLDAGPMSGVNNVLLDETFFPDGKTKSIFITAFGYGDRDKLHPRHPRLGFAEACRIE